MRRLLGALLVSSVACAACSDRGPTDAMSSTTSPREVTTTSTTATTSTSTSTTEPVPFDVEVRRAAIELLELRNQNFMAPDPARVADYIADTCTCLERERGFIEGFVGDGVRWTVGPIQVRGISISNADPASPLMTLVAREPEAELIKHDGTVLEEAVERDAVGYTIVLERNPAGEWRVNALRSVPLSDDTIASVLAEGLP